MFLQRLIVFLFATLFVAISSFAQLSENTANKVTETAPSWGTIVTILIVLGLVVLIALGIKKISIKPEKVLNEELSPMIEN